MSQLTLQYGDIQKGYRCSCCGQLVKQYKRSLNSSMALVLIQLYRSGIRDFVHVENYLNSIQSPAHRRADYHKLRFWGFLEKKIGDRVDGSPKNGYYKITGRGCMYVEGKLKAKEFIYLYNDQFKGFDGEEITIQQALGNKFSFEVLMAS